MQPFLPTIFWKKAFMEDVLHEIWNGVLQFLMKIIKIKCFMFGSMPQSAIFRLLELILAQILKIMIGKLGGKIMMRSSFISSWEKIIPLFILLFFHLLWLDPKKLGQWSKLFLPLSFWIMSSMRKLENQKSFLSQEELASLEMTPFKLEFHAKFGDIICLQIDQNSKIPYFYGKILLQKITMNYWKI